MREGDEPSKGKGRPSRTVLVVDDSTLIRQRLISTLGRIEGVDVVGEAEDVDGALLLCKELEPDVVTLDIMMQGRNGIDFLVELRKTALRPKVIVLTNYPYPAFRRRCQELGVDAFLNKATELGQVEDRIFPNGSTGVGKVRPPSPEEGREDEGPPG